jgi:hypothetical protein
MMKRRVSRGKSYGSIGCNKYFFFGGGALCLLIFGAHIVSILYCMSATTSHRAAKPKKYSTMFDVEPLGPFSMRGSSSTYPQVPPSSSSGTTNFSQRTCGVSRGIQGKNNSCYADVPLMAMFAFNTLFDSLLVAPPVAAAPSPSSSAMSVSRGARVVSSDAVVFFQQFLTLMVVNPLRKNGFVPFAHIMTLRSMLSQLLDGAQGDQFVHQASSEDVNMFLERLQQVLSGGPGQGGLGTSSTIASSGQRAPPPPLSAAHQAQQLLNIVVAIAPVLDPSTNHQKSVVTVEEILRANSAYPSCGSPQFQQPLWVNIPRSADGQLRYTMILPSLWLADLPPSSNGVGGAQPTNEQQSGSPCHLELSAIITYDVALQHYCGLFKIPPTNDCAAGGDAAGASSSWVEYDSMGGAELNEAVGTTDLVPRITPAGHMEIFEACAGNPVLESMCTEMFASDEFIEFMYRSVGSPSRTATAASNVENVNEWAVFRQAVRRPYLYLYVPRPGAVPSAPQHSPLLHLSRVDERHLPYLADSLMRTLFVKHSWKEALGHWQAHELAQCLPPPPTYGCPDCGATFTDEAAFVHHMRLLGCSVASPPTPAKYVPPTPPPVSATHSSSPLPSWMDAPLPPSFSSSSSSRPASGDGVTTLSPERSSASAYTRPADAYPSQQMRPTDGARHAGPSSHQHRHHLSSHIEPPSNTRGKAMLPRQACSSTASLPSNFSGSAILTEHRCDHCLRWVPRENLNTHRCWH